MLNSLIRTFAEVEQVMNGGVGARIQRDRERTSGREPSPPLIRGAFDNLGCVIPRPSQWALHRVNFELAPAKVGVWPYRGAKLPAAGCCRPCILPPWGDLSTASSRCPAGTGGGCGSLRHRLPDPHLLRHPAANLAPDRARRRRAEQALGRAWPNNCAGRLDEDLDRLQLSAGETQLLVIARILLSRRPLIVLDEATSDLVTAACARWRSCSIATGPEMAIW